MPRGVQATVNTVPAPAVAGDFASANPRFTALAGPGGYVSGAAGATIGAFCWQDWSFLDPDGNPTNINSFGNGPVTGFIARYQQGLITQFLSDASMIIPQGFDVTVMSGGDFWVVNNGTTFAVQGQKAYADLATGLVSFAATGSPAQATSTAASIAAGTFSVTGSVNGNVLTVTAVGSGVVVIGGIISGTGIATGTQIRNQLSGTAGGIGTYSLSIGEQTAASTTVSGTYGTLTVGGTIVGTIPVGAAVGGSGVTAGTVITARGTGTGGAGTYIVNTTQTVGSEALTFNTNVETKWIAMSQAAAGELIKISDHPLG